MTGIESEDRLPLLAACAVMVLGNLVVFFAQWTIYTSVLFAPIALVAFGVTRYAITGAPFPRPLEE